MIRYKYIFGPYIPMNEARIWLQSWTLQVRTYFFIFAVIAALCHPSQQISKASVLSQFAFWTIGYFIFLLVYPFVQLLCVKLTLALQCFTLFISIPLGISNCIIGSIMYFLCPFLGISVDDHYDVLKFYIFNAVLFEIGAYCYIAYVDRAIFPEIYLDEFGDSARNDTSKKEFFLRGSDMPVHMVETIFADDNGVVATSRDRSVFIARPFGTVVAELPVRMGYQIHRSLWVSRKLAMRFESEGRQHFIKLPDGRRLPIARGRKSGYVNWLNANIR